MAKDNKAIDDKLAGRVPTNSAAQHRDMYKQRTQNPRPNLPRALRRMPLMKRPMLSLEQAHKINRKAALEAHEKRMRARIADSANV